MKSHPLLLCFAAAAFFLASCAENPADSVPKADVSEPAAEASAPAATESEAPAPVAPVADQPASEPAPAPAAEEPDSGPEAAAEETAYSFTDESSIGFVGSKVTGSHEGGFKTFSGSFSIAGDKPGSGPHSIVIEMDSVWSDADKLTEHLKSADFFEVETYPTATFTVTGIEPAEEGNSYTLSGTLELHGVTKAITFPAAIARRPDGKVTLDSEFAINRKDFGIDYPGKADDLIREEVVIKLAMVAAPGA